jgi:hypothetical protein
MMLHDTSKPSLWKMEPLPTTRRRRTGIMTSGPLRSELVRRWAVALAVLAVAGCGATTHSTMVHSWMDPAHGSAPIQRVLVIGLVKSATTRQIFETHMAGILQKNGVTAIPSYDLLQDPQTVGDEAAVRELVRAAVTKSGADAVTVTRLVAEETSQEWVHESTYVAPMGYYGSFYPYYYGAYQVISTPGYVVEEKTYVVETNLYDVATEKLIWTGISETVNLESAIKGIDSVGGVVVASLKKEGLIAK